MKKLYKILGSTIVVTTIGTTGIFATSNYAKIAKTQIKTEISKPTLSKNKIKHENPLSKSNILDDESVVNYSQVNKASKIKASEQIEKAIGESKKRRSKVSFDITNQVDLEVSTTESKDKSRKKELNTKLSTNSNIIDNEAYLEKKETKHKKLEPKKYKEHPDTEVNKISKKEKNIEKPIDESNQIEQNIVEKSILYETLSLQNEALERALNLEINKPKNFENKADLHHLKDLFASLKSTILFQRQEIDKLKNVDEKNDLNTRIDEIEEKVNLWYKNLLKSNKKAKFNLKVNDIIEQQIEKKYLKKTSDGIESQIKTKTVTIDGHVTKVSITKYTPKPKPKLVDIMIDHTKEFDRDVIVYEMIESQIKTKKETDDVDIKIVSSTKT